MNIRMKNNDDSSNKMGIAFEKRNDPTEYSEGS